MVKNKYFSKIVYTYVGNLYLQINILNYMLLLNEKLVLLKV